MMTYGQLFLTLLPVFALIALGVLLRRVGWLTEAGEPGLMNLVVKVALPALIYEAVAGNPALRTPGNLLLAPLAGGALTLLSMAVCWQAARALGLTLGHGLRTFALTAGLTNYAYLPLPLMDALFGPESRAVLLVHNVGVEAAVWTGGVLVVTGLSPRQGWRQLLNLPVLALGAGLAVNLTGLAGQVPAFLTALVHALAVCAIPLGLLLTGASLQPHLDEPRRLVDARVTPLAVLLRLAVLPWIFLLAARWLPGPVELQRVLVVQAAMPAAVIPILIARAYGGRPLVAVQIVLGTTVLALFTIPFWIRFGLRFAGLGP